MKKRGVRYVPVGKYKKASVLQCTRISFLYTMNQHIQLLGVKLDTLYDFLFQKKHIAYLERITVLLAAFGFIAHIIMVFLVRNVGSFSVYQQVIGAHYLSAIYTPFTVILFFEVLLMVLALQNSITKAIGRQFEIISLIVIREAFRDLGALETVTVSSESFEPFYPVLFDMLGAVSMFFLVAVFYHIKRSRARQEDFHNARAKKKFIALKKTMALFLSVILFALALYSFGETIQQVISHGVFYAAQDIEIGHAFYSKLFMIMVFVNVFILVLSYVFTSDYELVFRNSGFVITTILILFSLTLPKPYNIGLGIIAMIFAICVRLIYNFFRKIDIDSF